MPSIPYFPYTYLTCGCEYLSMQEGSCSGIKYIFTSHLKIGIIAVISMAESKAPAHGYTEESIRSLDWKEHIRTRPGMYIGKLGDGSSKDDGIYVLL